MATVPRWAPTTCWPGRDRRGRQPGAGGAEVDGGRAGGGRRGAVRAAAGTRRRRDGPGGFGADAQEALRLPFTEAVGLGHNYVGCEHLLLGLVAEPDGPGGQLLRGMGVELRVTRRTVAGALAGWMHLRSQATGGTAPAAPAGTQDLAATLAAAVRDQLAPVLTRLDRLEQRLASERVGQGREPRPHGQPFPSDRAMTMRWIWLVPSTICSTFASRM